MQYLNKQIASLHKIILGTSFEPNIFTFLFLFLIATIPAIFILIYFHGPCLVICVVYFAYLSLAPSCYYDNLSFSLICHKQIVIHFPQVLCSSIISLGLVLVLLLKTFTLFTVECFAVVADTVFFSKIKNFLNFFLSTWALTTSPRPYGADGHPISSGTFPNSVQI